MPDNSEEEKARSWKSIPELKDTRLGALVNDYREIEVEIADLEKRRVAIRELIEPLIIGVPGSVKAIDRLLYWNEPSETEKIDVSKLVRLGVTPDIIQQAMVKKPKRGFLTIRALPNASDSSETPSDGSPAEDKAS